VSELRRSFLFRPWISLLKGLCNPSFENGILKARRQIVVMSL